MSEVDFGGPPRPKRSPARRSGQRSRPDVLRVEDDSDDARGQRRLRPVGSPRSAGRRPRQRTDRSPTRARPRRERGGSSRLPRRSGDEGDGRRRRRRRPKSGPAGGPGPGPARTADVSLEFADSEEEKDALFEGAQQGHGGRLGEPLAVVRQQERLQRQQATLKRAQLMSDAATCIQAAARGRAARRQAEQLRHAVVAVRLQAVARGFLARQHRRRLHLELARRVGVMLSLPGTVQGETGWYEADRKAFYVYMTPRYEWRLICGPMPLGLWRDTLRRAKESDVLVAVPPDTLQGQSGFYVDAHAEVSQWNVSEDGRWDEVAWDGALCGP